MEEEVPSLDGVYEPYEEEERPIEPDHHAIHMSEVKALKHLARQTAIDVKDREYDSDDEIKLEMKTYDDRLSFINKIDAQAYN